MTSEEIKTAWSGYVLKVEGQLLLEIAYQLARLNEQIEEELLRQEHVRDNS